MRSTVSRRAWSPTSPTTSRLAPSTGCAHVYGFRERRDARLTFPGGLRAWLELEGALIGITSPGHGLVSPRKLAGRSQALKLYVTDVDAHHAHARAAGAEIESEPGDGFWGGRIYRTLDLEGHALRVLPVRRRPRGRRLDAPAWSPPRRDP